MRLDEFIITVFCWVTQELETVTDGVKLRTRGFAPRLSDSEVITMERVGELLGYAGDEAIWKYFRQHWAVWFPGLGNRTTFLRQAANLWWVKQPLQERLVTDLGARTADCHIIDGFPITMCNPARASRSRVLKYGYCAAKEEHYCGLKANLLIDLRRTVVGITLPAAHVDERESAYDLVSVIAGLLLGDKGFSRPPFNVDGDVLGIDLQTSLCKNMIERRPRGWLPLLQRLRQRVEAMISQREQRVGLAKTRTHDVWHLTYQVTQKLLAHTLGIWLNLHQGREPLELDSLVAA
ncbi:MAG TPA: IS982 family transposase [Candidatus Competibacteraceae bacterium]|nr:IS982 family transposase [Candidatus Competibacteraceae bacterium]